jgi:hypothetical protein
MLAMGVLAMVLAMVSVDFFCMILVMLFVGLFDMGLRVVVDIYILHFEGRAIFWMGLFLAPVVGVDVPRVVSFLAVPLFVRTVCSPPPCCGVPQASSAPF